MVKLTVDECLKAINIIDSVINNEGSKNPMWFQALLKLEAVANAYINGLSRTAYSLAGFPVGFPNSNRNYLEYLWEVPPMNQTSFDNTKAAWLASEIEVDCLPVPVPSSLSGESLTIMTKMSVEYSPLGRPNYGEFYMTADQSLGTANTEQRVLFDGITRGDPIITDNFNTTSANAWKNQDNTFQRVEITATLLLSYGHSGEAYTRIAWAQSPATTLGSGSTARYWNGQQQLIVNTMFDVNFNTSINKAFQIMCRHYTGYLTTILASGSAFYVKAWRA